MEINSYEKLLHNYFEALKPKKKKKKTPKATFKYIFYFLGIHTINIFSLFFLYSLSFVTPSDPSNI